MSELQIRAAFTQFPCPNLSENLRARERARANRTEARVIALFGRPYYVDTMPDKVTTTYEHGDEFIIAGTEIEGSNLNREPRRRRLG
jgi:hypothetical protein